MVRWFPRTAVALSILAVGGCGLIHEARKGTTYETVQADPHHDTALAEAEHKQAVEILCSREGCSPPALAKAENHLQQALVADVTYGPAHNTLGTVYLRERKLYLAAWEFEYASKLMPDKAEPFYNLGLVYEQADRLERAIDYYNMAFSMAPRNSAIVEGLVRARLRNGENVADVRHLLQEIVLYENRPVWVCWAKEQLALKGEPSAGAQLPLLPPAGPQLPGLNRGLLPPPMPGLPEDHPAGAPANAPELVLPPRIATPSDQSKVLSLQSLEPGTSSAIPSGEPLTINSPARSTAGPLPNRGGPALQDLPAAGSIASSPKGTGADAQWSDLQIGIDTGHATVGGEIPQPVRPNETRSP